MTTTSKKLIPNKRFPEFENSGEWVEKKLKEYCDIIVGGDAPEKFSKERTEQFSIPIYSNGVGEKMLYGYTNKARVFDECVTVSARGTIGYTVYHNKPFYPIVRLLCLVPNKLLCSLFLKYQLDIVNIEGTQVGISQLTAPMVSEYHILVPLLNEQQKIADFLSSVDELIELEQQKLEKLKEYKKGLLQSIFGSNGRDKCVIDNFNCVSDKLKNISMIIMGASPAKEKANTEYGIEFHQGKSFFDYLYIKDSKKYTTDYSKQINEDYIIMSVRAPVGEINLTDREIALGRGLCGIKPFKVNKLYLYYYLLYFKNLINYNAKGLVFDSITKSDVENIYIKFPPDTIQENIGNTLFFLDKIIIEQINKVEKIQEYKKGLLQQLFPN